MHMHRIRSHPIKSKVFGYAYKSVNNTFPSNLLTILTAEHCANGGFEPKVEGIHLENKPNKITFFSPPINTLERWEIINACTVKLISLSVQVRTQDEHVIQLFKMTWNYCHRNTKRIIGLLNQRTLCIHCPRLLSSMCTIWL